MKRIFFFLWIGICGLMLVSCSKDQHTDPFQTGEFPDLKGRHLVAYVAAREEVGNALLSSFCETRGCTYEYIRLSTEEILRRVTAENGKPQADLVLGGTVDAHIQMKQQQLSSPARSRNAAFISEHVKDADGYWYGYEAEQLAIAVNEERWREELKPSGIPLPQTWEDLLDPAYQGGIVMSDPKYSGTAYTFLLSLFERWGDDRAAGYLRRLNENIGTLTVNGYMPAQYVSVGEYTIGINFLGDQRKLREAGFPIASIVPEDTGISVNAVSKLKHAPHGNIADTFIDYCLSPEAAADVLERMSYGIPTVRQDKMERLDTAVIHREESTERHDRIIEIWDKLCSTTPRKGR